MKQNMLANDRLVGFEASALEHRASSGVGQYASRLLEALVRDAGEWRYILLANGPIRHPHPRGVAFAPGGHVPFHSLWMQLALPLIVRRLRPRLCHFTNYLAPLALQCPYAVTIHDMSLFLYPRMQPWRSLWLVRSLLPMVARRASAVITVSQSAKREILRIMKLPPDRVHVVYSAAGPGFQPVTDRARLDHVRRAYGLDSPFMLTVCTIEPRKNLSRLFAAVRAVRRSGKALHLVVAGPLGWRYTPVLRQIEQDGLQDSVRLLGYVPSEDLPAIYTLSRGLAFPSLYEGFGLPIVEAMACGVPVLTSRCSAMAEVSAGAALQVDPLNVEDIQNGLIRLTSDETLRTELSRSGIERASEFSWTKSAIETAAIYEAIAK